MDSCKGTRKVLKQISDHRQTAACKAQAVAVGTQNKLTDLRLGPFNTALQKRFSTERQKTFIATSHAFGEASGEDHACNYPGFICHEKLLLRSEERREGRASRWRG